MWVSKAFREEIRIIPNPSRFFSTSPGATALLELQGEGTNRTLPSLLWNEMSFFPPFVNLRITSSCECSGQYRNWLEISLTEPYSKIMLPFWFLWSSLVVFHTFFSVDNLYSLSSNYLLRELWDIYHLCLGESYLRTRVWLLHFFVLKI